MTDTDTDTDTNTNTTIVTPYPHPLPTSANGYPVLAASATPGASPVRAGFVILVDRGDRYRDRYVTAWLPAVGDGGWFWGHYFERMEEAQADYAVRVLRKY